MKPLNPRITGWQGRRVWIIGASSGIGRSLAEQLGGAGAELALSARSEEGLREIAREQDQVLPLDVADPVTLERVRDRLLTQWGGIDMTFYCAGVYYPMRAWEINLQQVNAMLSVNLQGLYNLLPALLPHYLKQGRGGLCLLASVAGYSGLPKALGYGPTKAALINLAQILYSDLSPRGIGIYLVNPGFVDTRLTRQNDFTMPALVTPGEAARAILDGIARGRFEIDFPRRFTRPMKWLARLPPRLRFYLLRRAVTP
ncbi:MAG: SDR family NAD(P)-dependent oxidoreductase [Sedimenticola sp.]|nr:SDR family NAD(P)-dependent oxidoreductase [Sedimenticola sp.]